MSGGDTGVCWCAGGDSKCPHAINSRINSLWNEMEASVDEVLEQFDRRSIKKYLSKEHKPSQTEKFKQVYGASAPDLDKVVKHTAETRESRTSQGARHPLKDMKDRPGTAPNGHGMTGAKGGKKMARKPLDPGMSKPHALAEGDLYGKVTTDGKGYAHGMGNPRNMVGSKSTTALPHVPGASTTGQAPVSKQLDLRVDPADTETHGLGKSGGKDMRASKRQDDVGGGPEDGVGTAVNGEAAISMGLLRIADKLSRKVLPWQAQCCPRAVEQMRDYRMSVIQGKHSEFVLRMKKQLDNKVINFLAKKDEEVDFWMQKEIKTWMDAMHKQETEQANFFEDDIERIATRVNAQEAAAKERELRLAHELDNKERDNTRDQLVKFRRLCREKDKMQNADTRALYASFENAQGKVSANETLQTREVAKGVETAHDWLCCLADNAVTAASSEGILSGMFTTLDKERERAVGSLHSAMEAYTQQHNAILDAIVQFSARIHRHASDYLSREHLISKAFLQYLLSVISGEIKPHTSEVRRSSIAWEGKFVSDRAHKMDQALNKEFNLSLMPFDKLVTELRERMVRQLDNVTVKMQGILNGREQDINKRKALLHKKLALHVNKACNARRRRLKSNVKLEKVEAALEEKALSSINDMSAELRTAVDQIWVKEHLRERRMYEASAGRMDRLKKSALVIWKKHSHLALGQKEDYEDWLKLYRQDRDQNSAERRHRMMGDWEEWREGYGKSVKGVSQRFRPWFRNYLNSQVRYDAEVPIDENVKNLTLATGNVLSVVKQGLSNLRRQAQEYVTNEMKVSDEYFVERRRLLIDEWQDNLFRLNDAVNRRVGKLKDTEGDLEETLRLTLAQHEIEAVVFEQSSCARLENFWLNSREKISALGKELMDAQMDIAMAKSSGSAVQKKSRNDREIDGILDMSAEQAKPGQGHKSAGGGGHKLKSGSASTSGEGKGSGSGGGSSGGSRHQFCDTFGMKRLLDEVRSDVYRDFGHTLLKAFEVAKKRRGVGKRRYLPAHLAAQVLFKHILDFWDAARFTEKLVGRMKFKGEVLFKDGLPLHARPAFVIASTIACLSETSFKGRTSAGGNGMLDCDDVLALIEKGPKRFFLTGLIHICVDIGTFGENQLRSECMWACTSCAIAPPVELFEGRENVILGRDWDRSAKEAGQAYGGGAASESAAAHALKAGIPGAVNFAHHVGGYFMEDPVDLLNSVLFLDREDGDGLDAYYEPDPAARDSKYKEAEKLVGIDELFPHISSVFPATDLMVLAALLGRPERQFEVTTHRFCQAVITWRRIALSITLAVSDSPGADYPRIQDLITTHSITRTGKRKSGYANIACASPFEAVAAVLDWMTSISSLPVSVLQGFCLFTRGGSCDPWLEDPKQSRRGDRFLYELSEWVQIMMQSADFESDETAFPAALSVLLRDELAKFDLQGGGIIPAELLRSYVKKEDPDLSNLQVTATFWSVNRGRGMEADMLDLAAYLHAEPSVLAIEEGAAGDGEEEGKGDGEEKGEGGELLLPLLEAVDPSHFDEVADAQSAALDTHGGNSNFLDRYENHTLASNRPKPIETVFNGNSAEYMSRFKYDVDAYLSAAPSLDTNVVLGMLPAALNPSSAHELLADAMRLDPSAKNNIPSSVCVWIGARNMRCDAAIKQATLERNPKWDEGPSFDWRDPDREEEQEPKIMLPLGVRNLSHEDEDTPLKSGEEMEAEAAGGLGDERGGGTDSTAIGNGEEKDASAQHKSGKSGTDGAPQNTEPPPPPMHARLLRHLLEVRMRVEMDYIVKYPQICEQRNSDEHYGAAGGAPLDGDNHWEDAFERRLARVDKLTAAWRDTMMSEWGNSLYGSRQGRYEHRATIVRECVTVYHDQYEELKESIVKERSELLTQYKQLELELKDIVREDSGFITYHGSFIERQLRNLEGVLHRCMNIFHGALEKFLQHCGGVKRRGLERVREAKQRMKESMERSCTGLIVGYTGGFAQGAFDELMYRGEHWRKGVTEMHGNLIFEKEAFVHAKEESERDLAMQISDRITLDRARTKGLLDGLAEDSASLQEVISNTRASYAAIQKDANSRLLIRIEKALRESRKLRAAAEDQPELEPAVLREIRVILDQAKTACDSIVAQIKLNSEGQLRAIEPMRNPHREKMEDKISTLEVGWSEVEELLLPLIVTFEKGMGQKLGALKANCTEGVGEYRENETRALEREYKKERRALVQAFREHFTTYDLSEASIFEKFNYEVQDAVFEMKNMWGPTRPTFISTASNEVSDLAHGLIKRTCNDVKATSWDHASSSDDSIYGRQELADMLCHGLLDLHSSVDALQGKFEQEKEMTLAEVESMKMDETGDIVRPQVTAVVDLLCSAIEIDLDFSKGYETLIKSTGERSEEALTELSDFMGRFETPAVDGSLPQAVEALRGRVIRRKQEVSAVVEAANSHVVADNTRIEVVLQAGHKDIGEWETLTKQLVENAFFNAEKNLMSSLFETPPASPRREDELPPDEDRVSRIKELLKKTHEPADFDHAQDMEKTQRRNDKRRAARGPLDATPMLAAGQNVSLNLNKGDVDPGKTKELQQGWLECYTAEGYTYFYNPGTGESLWDLPAAMKVPLYDDDEVRLIETPRDLVTGEFFDPNHDERDESDPTKKADAAGLRGLGDNTSSTMVKDKRVLMSDVAENARAFASGGMDTAVDVTSVLKGVKRGKRLDLPTKKKATKEDADAAADGEDATLGASTYVTSHGEETTVVEGAPADRVPDHALVKRPAASQEAQEAGAGGTAIGMGLDAVMAAGGEEEGVLEPAAAAEEATDPVDDASVVTQELMIQQGAFLDALNDDEMDYDAKGQENNDGTGNLLAMGLLGSEEEMSVQLMIEDEANKEEAERKYKEAREADAMYKEEVASEAVEADYEQRLRDVFHNKLLKCIDSTTGVTNPQVDELKLLARALKRISVIEEFADNGVSWDKLQEKVFQTLAAEEEARLLGERLKTEQGRERQKKILEHQEDIEEMGDFFRKECNLSRTNARKAATECVMRNICTQKKLAKVWVRGDIDLEKDLFLDEDDAEDVAMALKTVHEAQAAKNALNASMASMSMSQTNASLEANAFTTMGTDQSFYTQPALTPSQSFYNQQTPQQQQEQQQQQTQGYDQQQSYPDQTGYEQQEQQYDENGYPLNPDGTYAEDQAEAYDQQGQEDPNDPAAGYYEDPNQQYDESGYPINADGTYADQAGAYDQQEGAAGDAAGGSGLPEGWYEAYTDTGDLYYYNEQTGESSWEWPGGQQEYQDPSAGGNYYDQGQGYSPSASQTGSQSSQALVPTTGAGRNSARLLPVPVLPEVAAYSRDEGVNRQLALLTVQDRWQNLLVKSQFFLTEQRSLFNKNREDMFKKVTDRLESRLGVFVDDIKYMQRTLKKEMTDLNSTERDLRRLYDEENPNVIIAEKLSFILGGLEKLKTKAGSRYDSAIKQIEKCGDDWNLIEAELLQMGNIFDESNVANLDQCRMACEHNAKLFAYDQAQNVVEVKGKEMVELRKNVRHLLLHGGESTNEAEQGRDDTRQRQRTHAEKRAQKRVQLRGEMGNYPDAIENELQELGLEEIETKHIMREEEEITMSFLLTQVEMEASLASDYDSISEATRKIAKDLQEDILQHDAKEKVAIHPKSGSMFNRHRDTISRHGSALRVTLNKVRGKVKEGYALLNGRIEALDFDVERQAEEELAAEGGEA